MFDKPFTMADKAVPDFLYKEEAGKQLRDMLNLFKGTMGTSKTAEQNGRAQWKIKAAGLPELEARFKK